MTRPGRHDEHSTYSASSAERWSSPDGCPASAILTKLAGPSPSSEAAQRGTHAHALLEKMIKGEPADMDGYSKEDLTAVMFAVDIILEMCRDSESWSERRWDLPICAWLPADDAVYGYADFVRYHHASKRLDVLDYKHGVHPVEPSAAQLMQYAKAALYELHDSGRYAEEIWLHVIQPNGYDHKPFKSHKTSEAELQDWENDAVAAIESNAPFHFGAGVGDLVYRPCARNCHWCKGFTMCEAAHETAWARTGDTTLPNNYGPHNIAHALNHADFMAVWIKEVQAIGLDLAKGGVQIEGRKLVTPETRRKFIGERDDVARKLWDIAGISPAESLPPELVSPAAAEKLIRGKLKGKAKEKDLQKALVAFAELVDKPSSDRLDLVPATDKRQAVDPRQKFFSDLVKPLEAETGK